MSTKAKTASSKSPEGIVARLVAPGREAGNRYLDTVEHVGERIASLQERVADAARPELVGDVIALQANGTRDLVDAYASAGRKLVA